MTLRDLVISLLLIWNVLQIARFVACIGLDYGQHVVNLNASCVL